MLPAILYFGHGVAQTRLQIHGQLARSAARRRHRVSARSTATCECRVERRIRQAECVLDMSARSPLRASRRYWRRHAHGTGEGVVICHRAIHQRAIRSPSTRRVRLLSNELLIQHLFRRQGYRAGEVGVGGQLRVIAAAVLQSWSTGALLTLITGNGLLRSGRGQWRVVSIGCLQSTRRFVVLLRGGVRVLR